MNTKTKPCEVCGSDMEFQRSTKRTCSTACRAALGRMEVGGRIPSRALPAGHRWCTLCSEGKPTSDFYVSRNGRVFSYCKPCKRADARRRLRHARGLPEGAHLSRGPGHMPVGSTRSDSAGYVLEKVGEDHSAHHRADASGWVYQHILVAERKYGILITREYTVHHQNGDRSDNRPGNLELRHGPHGKGADILPFVLRTESGRSLAIRLLEDYGYSIDKRTN